MDSVCEFISNNIQDTEESCKYIEQYVDEYHTDMHEYVISYLKQKLGDTVINPRYIVENDKTVIQFSMSCRNCEIYEYSGILGEDYWVAIIINPIIDEQEYLEG